MPVSGQGSQGSAFPCTVLCQRPIAENQNPKSRRLQAGGPGSHLCPGFLAEGGLAPRECSPVSSPTQEHTSLLRRGCPWPGPRSQPTLHPGGICRPAEGAAVSDVRDQGCDGAGWRQRLSRSTAWKVGKGPPPKDGSASRCPSVRDQLRGEGGGAARGQHGNRCGAEGGGRSTDPLPDVAHKDPMSDPHVVAQRWAVASSLDLRPSAQGTPAPAHPSGQQVPAWKDEAAAEPWAAKSEDQTQALNRKGDAPPTPADDPRPLASVSSPVVTNTVGQS